jgi:hypothetical protein
MSQRDPANPDFSDLEQLEDLRGDVYVPVHRVAPSSLGPATVSCSRCKGTGQHPCGRCFGCDGTGRMLARKTGMRIG